MIERNAMYSSKVKPVVSYGSRTGTGTIITSECWNNTNSLPESYYRITNYSVYSPDYYDVLSYFHKPPCHFFFQVMMGWE